MSVNIYISIKVRSTYGDALTVESPIAAAMRNFVRCMFELKEGWERDTCWCEKGEGSLVEETAGEKNPAFIDVALEIGKQSDPIINLTGD